MGKESRKWRTIGILDSLFFRIKAVIRFTGHMSVSEYARFAIQQRLQHDEVVAEEQKMLEEEIKERLS